jgi:hypothetical protein
MVPVRKESTEATNQEKEQAQREIRQSSHKQTPAITQEPQILGFPILSRQQEKFKATIERKRLSSQHMRQREIEKERSTRIKRR